MREQLGVAGLDPERKAPAVLVRGLICRMPIFHALWTKHETASAGYV